MTGGKAPGAPGTDPVRRAALRILTRLEDRKDGRDGGYLQILTDRAIKKSSPQMSDADRALLTLLTAGVTERRITLDHIIAQLSSRELPSLDPEVLALCRMGIYQLGYTDRIPAHAAVYETVALAGRAKGFVNGILRSYLRRREEISFPARPLPPGEGLKSEEYLQGFSEYLSVNFSLDPGLCRRLVSVLGEEGAVSAAEAFFSAPRPTLRANTLRTTPGGLAQGLAAEGFEALPTADAPFGLRIISGRGLPAAVGAGLAFVQDEASQIAGEVLGARPGDFVLDACTCPGSKAFYAAMSMENRGRIVACDIHASKLPLVGSGAERLGIDIIETAERDSSAPLPDGMKESFDRVICDVPCSGYGVIAKKPELRYKRPDDPPVLPGLQYRILESASEALKPGGRLVYSTCTLLPEENTGVVGRFLSDHPDFAAADFAVGSRRSSGGSLTLLPGGGTDGFFIALIVRKQTV